MFTVFCYYRKSGNKYPIKTWPARGLASIHVKRCQETSTPADRKDFYYGYETL